ncbi:helix-turn-helix domain-containing protein [Bacteriovoracales bacterium]|nr:helix-turn-helix domain-containing protein [Bacteriovoracales bacterium]
MGKKGDSMGSSGGKTIQDSSDVESTEKEVLKEAPMLRLGDILKKEMKIKGLTISHLSKECGISRTTIHNWIQGIGPSANNIPSLITLCLYFDVSLEYLLFGMEFSKGFTGENDASSEMVYQGNYEDRGELYSINIKRLKSPN